MPRLTDLTAATTPLDGTEVLYVVQGGNSRRTVTQEVVDLVDVPAIASQAQAEAGTADNVVMTPLKLRQGLRANGSAPVYACRAWVNFNGTGTVAIRSSGNVSSITDNGVGLYTVNFTTAMGDANYCVIARSDFDLGARNNVFCDYGSPAVGSVQILTSNSAAAAQDHEAVNVLIFH